MRVAANILLLFGILIALFLVSRPLGAAFTLFAVVTIVGLYFVRGIAVPYQKAHRDAMTDLQGFLEERLAGTEDIRSCGAVDFVLRHSFNCRRRFFAVFGKPRYTACWWG